MEEVSSWHTTRMLLLQCAEQEHLKLRALLEFCLLYVVIPNGNKCFNSVSISSDYTTKNNNMSTFFC